MSNYRTELEQQMDRMAGRINALLAQSEDEPSDEQFAVLQEEIRKLEDMLEKFELYAEVEP